MQRRLKNRTLEWFRLKREYIDLHIELLYEIEKGVPLAT